MRALRLLAAMTPVIAALGCGTGTDDGFKLIHVSDLVSLLGATDRVAVLDANGTDFRAREGVIPGAVLLSSYKQYDVEKELPSGKDVRLVFYCADPH